MFKHKKIETISFHDFMATNRTEYEKKKSLTKDIYAMSSIFPVITPESFFPVHELGFLLFVAGGVLIVGSAFIENLFAKTGLTMVAEIIKDVSKVAFPVLVYGTVFWFLFTL